MLAKILSRAPIMRHTSALQVQSRMLSSYFDELDKISLKEFGNSYCGSKAYRKAVDLWKVPLQKKALRK